jgi:hypothetical protein
VSAAQERRDRISAALDAHIRRVHQDGLFELDLYPAGVLITYGELCPRSMIPRSVGSYLTQIAVEHRKAQRPPADCLVVRKGTKLPGSGYSSGGGFDRLAWERAIKSVLAHKI